MMVRCATPTQERLGFGDAPKPRVDIKGRYPVHLCSNNNQVLVSYIELHCTVLFDTRVISFMDEFVLVCSSDRGTLGCWTGNSP